MSTQTSFDLTGLSRAISGRDCSYHLALYTDDARVQIVDSIHSDATLQVLKGKAEIGEWLDGMSSAAVHYEVRDAIVHRDRIAYTEECRYEDGSKVLLDCSAEVRRGQITDATVRLVQVPPHQSLPRLAQPSRTWTLDHQRGQVLPKPALPTRAVNRSLAGNFLG